MNQFENYKNTINFNYFEDKFLLKMDFLIFSEKMPNTFTLNNSP